MKQRLFFLVKLFATLLALFALQKVVFMMVNAGYAHRVPFWTLGAVIWHGLRLDSVTAAYILIVPTLSVVVSSFFCHYPLRRTLKAYFVVVAILMATVFIADVVLYHFWGAKMDAADLMYARNPKDMLASLKLLTIIAVLVVLAATAFVFGWIMIRITPVYVDGLKNRWHTLLMIPVAALVFLAMRGGTSESTANPSYAYFSDYHFCNDAALNPLFNLMHSMSKSEDLYNEFAALPSDEAAAVASPFFASDPTVGDTLLLTQRPDILLVVWEGGGWDMVMNDSVAPNLMRYCREGVLFTNCYANNFRTDRGLVSLLSGWMGLPTVSLMKMNARCRRLPSLAETLSRNGYSTHFHYGGDIDFTNMRGYLLETGYNTVDGSESFPAARRKSSWGAPDAYLLVPSVVMSDNDRRFFSTVLTLSSHEPWTVPMQRFDDERKNAFAYTDSCLGVLLDSLKLMPQWNNLLVIVVPDHGVPLSSAKSTSDPAVAHIPMLWTGGAVRKRGKVDVMMMQSDLAATLLAQLGIDNGERKTDNGERGDFIFSRNVLSQHFTGNQYFALHCFKSGCNYIDSTGSTRFNCGDRTATPVEGNPPEDHEYLIKALLQYIYQKTAKL